MKTMSYTHDLDMSIYIYIVDDMYSEIERTKIVNAFFYIYVHVELFNSKLNVQNRVDKVNTNIFVKIHAYFVLS